MAGKLNITVLIEGIRMPLQVDSPEEEKLYRDAALTIQRRIQMLRDAYPDQSNLKYYAMAMLTISADAAKLMNKADTQPYIDMMHDIEKEIEALGIK